ncbi:MAG: response regulator [bacterium]
MKKNIDPLGGLLVMDGSLTEDQLADVLEQQRLGLPFASYCFLLGYVDEDNLVRNLSRQIGVPGVVLARSIISLQNLRDIPYEIAKKYVMLPLYEDQQHVFVAVSDLRDQAIVNELAIIKGKGVIPHVAVHFNLVRTIRDCYRLMEAGDSYWFGHATTFEDLIDPEGLLVSISDVDEAPEAVEAAPLDVTDPNIAFPVDPEDIVEAEPFLEDEGVDEELDLDAHAPLPTSRRILIVDPDEKSRHLLTKILEQEGHTLSHATTGVEAVREIRQNPPELAIIEVMLPQIQGYQLCRNIKSSVKYGHIPVVLVTSAESGELPGRELLDQYGADELITRPINQSELLGTVNLLLSQARAPQVTTPADEGLFDEALGLYRDQKAEEAVATLRRALDVDPLSPRYHFVLGNILQHLELHYEAIDAYENTVSLRPDYFPALSRLAFLYYKQGFLKRALQTWKRCLEHCPDEEQASRIQEFMSSLESELEERQP